MSAVLWISQAHKCKALFPPTAVGNATYISHHLGEGHPSATAEQLQMFLHGDTDTQPFGESTWGQKEEGIAAKSPERGTWECPELPGRRAQRWAMMYSALLCLLPPGHTGWAPRGKSDFQALVSLQLHAIYLLVPDTLQRAFVNLLEKTHTLITEGSYSQDAMWSKLAPSSDVAS